MTTRGTRLAMVFAMVIVCFLPKRVDCGWPGGECAKPGRFRQMCSPYEVEPLGFFAIEYILHRDIGFAYSSGEECR